MLRHCREFVKESSEIARRSAPATPTPADAPPAEVVHRSPSRHGAACVFAAAPNRTATRLPVAAG
jgi:hypothetical protein